MATVYPTATGDWSTSTWYDDSTGAAYAFGVYADSYSRVIITAESGSDPKFLDSTVDTTFDNIPFTEPTGGGGGGSFPLIGGGGLVY